MRKAGHQSRLPPSRDGASKGRMRGILQADPADFQPALLRLQHQPPSPLPRAVLKTALALFGALLLWAAFGKLDIVAVAPGKLVPRSYVKIVQPADQGIVKEILVLEGATVNAGQVLIRMDTSVSDADYSAALSEYHEARLTARRIAAELADMPLQRNEDDPAEAFSRVDAQFKANRQAYRSALDLESSTLERARSELAGAIETEAKLQALLTSYQEEEAAYVSLQQQGIMPKLAVSEKTRDRIETEQDLRTQGFVIKSARTTIAQSRQRIDQLGSERNRKLQDEHAEVAKRLAIVEQDIAKLEHRQRLLELKAPQDGVVKELFTHTVGTVVSPGTVLMTVVPVNDEVRAEVWISNDDVGFVHPGQPVKLKLATFQFQKYGMIDGVVAKVSADAQDDSDEERRGASQLAYRALIDLKSASLEADGEKLSLMPGMQVSGEIKLGTRTVMEYFLSPVRKAFHEAARER